MPGVEHEVQVGLLGAGGQARGWSRPLGHHEDHGQFEHSGQAHALAHERETAARGAHQGPGPGMGRAQGHVHGRDLVLGLLGHQAGLPALVDEGQDHGGARGHGIERDEIAARGQGAQGDGLIAVEHEAASVALRGRRHAGEGEILLPDPGVGRAQHGQVGLDDLRGLLGKGLGHEPLQDGQVAADGRAEHAQGRHVVVKRLGRELAERHPQAGSPGRDGQVVAGHQHAPGAQPGQVQVHGLLVQGHQDVDVLNGGQGRVRAGADGEGVVAAADARHVVLGDHDLVAGPGHGPGHGLADGHQALPGLAAHQDVDVRGHGRSRLRRRPGTRRPDPGPSPRGPRSSTGDRSA